MKLEEELVSLSSCHFELLVAFTFWFGMLTVFVVVGGSVIITEKAGRLEYALLILT